MSTNTPSSTPTRVAIVTGASGGIGRAVAERFASDGVAVVVGYAGNADRATGAVAAITESGGTARPSSAHRRQGRHRGTSSA